MANVRYDKIDRSKIKMNMIDDVKLGKTFILMKLTDFILVFLLSALSLRMSINKTGMPELGFGLKGKIAGRTIGSSNSLSDNHVDDHQDQ